jgi:hypothetical protein
MDKANPTVPLEPKPTDPVSLETLAVFLLEISEPLESELQDCRRALSYFPVEHPVRQFLEAYVVRLEALQQGKLTQALSEQLIELCEILTAAGVLKPKPNANRYPKIVGNMVNNAGLLYEETLLAMDIATKSRSGPKFAATGMRALVMQVVEDKTPREIADALCKQQLEHSHEACIEQFSTQIKRLKEKIKKYASEAPR